MQLIPCHSRPVSWSRLVTCLALWGVLASASHVEAGSIVIPAWAFDRGNVVIHADPSEYADAGPVVGNGQKEPWGWTVEYDVDLPVEGEYTFQLCYATAEARPVEFFVDNQNLSKCCLGVTLDPKSSGQPDKFTWNSSGAKWEGVRNHWGRLLGTKLTKGVHTVKITRRGPLPHLVALSATTKAEFPKDWKPPLYTVKDIQNVPEKQRGAFKSPNQVAAFPTNAPPAVQTSGSLAIPAWTFDRGNVRIYASPDQFADAGPLIGNDPKHTGPGEVEYDIDFPVTGEYLLKVMYVAGEARPTEVFVDGKSMGKVCYDITFGSAPFEIPVVFSWNSSSTKDRPYEFLEDRGAPRRMSITAGKHTLKFARGGSLPHLVDFRLESLQPFPAGWNQQPRTIPHLDSVPPRERSVFMPANSVNVAALRLGIEDRIKTLGPVYPEGPAFLNRLAAFEKEKSTISADRPSVRVWACEAGMPEAQRTMEKKLAALRSDALLAHPALKFDKLLFFTRKTYLPNVYADNKVNEEGGSLCVLSPVSADGKVTSLVPELDGGIFTRFDLSFDAKKVVFGYKRKDRVFRIYEIDIDPVKGTMVPGSLRQLTFDDAQHAEWVKFFGPSGVGGGGQRGLDDMDPCYLPNGKIIFSSTRSERGVFCSPSVVATLYLMDGDGKNMRCLSGGPLSETDPCLLDDGRVVYTRWEYVDKGLGCGQSVWTVRPDGSGVDHVYKNTITRPGQMLNTRSIPGSRRLITVGAAHNQGRLGGPVILVDNRATRRTAEGMESITPELAYPGDYSVRYDLGFFREPYPFSETFYLVSHKSGEKGKDKNYGIYVLDAWGNRALLYQDPELSCHEPLPLRPRPMPTDILSVAAGDGKQDKTGTIFVQDVYQGMTGIERGRVKYIRVMGALPGPWKEKVIFRISLHGEVHRKMVYGVAKVHEDGSAFFTVPAGENLLFQALDENFMQLQHMPTFINVMPGEKRSCIGCHEQRRNAPRVALSRPQALDYPVEALAPQPGDSGPRPVHYVTDIQPILDRRCVSCHGGKDPKGHLDLTGEETTEWTRSYESLDGKGLVSVRDARYGRSGFRPQAPLNFGSHLSPLVARIREAPCKGDLTREEFIKIATWVDANSPFLGKYGERGGSTQQ